MRSFLYFRQFAVEFEGDDKVVHLNNKTFLIKFTVERKNCHLNIKKGK